MRFIRFVQDLSSRRFVFAGAAASVGRLPRAWILVCLSAVLGCGAEAKPTTYPAHADLGKTAKIVYERRELPSGKFQSFEVQDAARIQKVVSLLKSAEEIKSMQGTETLASVNYEITCQDGQGKPIGDTIEVLGPKAVVIGGKYYGVSGMIDELNAAVKK